MTGGKLRVITRAFIRTQKFRGRGGMRKQWTETEVCRAAPLAVSTDGAARSPALQGVHCSHEPQEGTGLDAPCTLLGSGTVREENEAGSRHPV